MTELMGWLGAEFGFMTPALVWAAPVIVGLLIAAYLRRGRGARVAVATLLFLRLLKNRPASRRRFVPPFRFFYELLLLLVLLAGASGLFRRGNEQKLAVLLDNSFSMSLSSPKEVISSNLLSVAKQGAAAYLGGLNSATRVEVFVTSPGLQSVSNGLVGAAAAADCLESIDFAFAADNLENALRRLMAKQIFDRVVAFSDHSLKLEPGASPSSEKLDLHSVLPRDLQKAAENVAITAITLGPEKLADQKADLEVTVRSFARATVEVPVVLSRLRAGAAAPEALDQASRPIAPGQTENFTFKVDIDGILGFKAELGRGTSRLLAAADWLTGDDQAFLAVAGSGDKLVLVSRFSAADLGLQRLRGIQFDETDLEGYLRRFVAGGERKPAFVFHRLTPDEYPDGNAMFVAPPADSRLIGVSPEVPRAQITRWDVSHPIMSYINIPALVLSSLRPLTAPDWGKELVSTSAGGAVIVGQRQGHRYLATGFEIFPYEGRERPLLSIFTLNALKWLSDFSAGAGYVAAGSRITLADGEDSARYLEEEWPLSVQESRSGQKRTVRAKKPGLLMVGAAASRARLIAVDFFNEEESNPLPQAITVPRPQPGGKPPPEPEMLTRGLALLALGLLCLEILAVTRIFGLIPGAGRQR